MSITEQLSQILDQYYDPNKNLKNIEEKSNDLNLNEPISEIKESYSVDELNKMNINIIKTIAKKCKVILSVSGKAKNKEQLINEIIIKTNNKN